MGSSMRKPSLVPRALRLTLASCAILAGGFAIPGAQAWAAESAAPTIDHVSAGSTGEHTAVLEAQINPHGSETAYEFRLVYQDAHPPANGESVTGGVQATSGRISAGFGDQTVSADLTDLQPGYTYWYEVGAINLYGETTGESPYSFGFLNSGAYPEGEGTGPQYSGNSMPVFTQWYNEHTVPGPNQALIEYEAKQQQQAKEHGELQAKEAAFRATEAAALKKREEEEAAAAAKDTGGISLAGKSVTVRSDDGMVPVKLTCLGIASCHGKLALTASDPTKVRGARAKGAKGGKKPHDVTIATGAFSIEGDETKRVNIELNPTGRALLQAADHGHLSASLEIAELAPGSRPAQTATVSITEPNTKPKLKSKPKPKNRRAGVGRSLAKS